MLDALEAKFIKLQFSAPHRLSLYQKILAFVEQGFPLNQILNDLHHQYNKYDPKSIRVIILARWIAAYNTGIAFSEAVEPWVPNNEMILIRSGESDDNLGTAISAVIDSVTAVSRMKNALLSHLFYPIFLLILLAGMIWGFVNYMIPELVAVLSPEKWPPYPHSFYVFSEVFTDYWIYILTAFTAFWVLAIQSLSRAKIPFRSFLDRLPPWSIYKNFHSSTFLIALSSMMRSGVALADSIQILQEKSSPYVKTYLDDMLYKMHHASSATGEILNNGFFTLETGVDLVIYGASDNFKDVITSIGRSAIDNGEKAIISSLKMINTLALFLVGGFLIWAYSSIVVLSTFLQAQAQSGAY